MPHPTFPARSIPLIHVILGRKPTNYSEGSKGLVTVVSAQRLGGSNERML
jgi:hypothetical protein